MDSTLARVAVVGILVAGCVGDAPSTPPTDAAVSADQSTVDADLEGGGQDAPADAPPAAVTGTVLDEQKNPVVGADVRIAGIDAKTDTLGKFTVSAPSTYDALVVTSTTGTTEIASSTGKKLTAFFGLSTRSPILQVSCAQAQTTTLALTTSGLGSLPAGDAVVLVTAPTNTSSSFAMDGSASQAVHWAGKAPASGSLYGYQYTGAGNYPTGWKAAAGPVSYSFPTGSASVTVPFTANPPTNTVALTTIPGGNTIVRTYVGYEPAPGARLLFFQFGFSGTSVNAVLPLGGSATVSVLGATPSGAGVAIWRVGLKIPSTPSVTLPTGDLAPSTPAAAATGIGVGTMFSWNALAPRAYHVRITCGSPATYLADLLTMNPGFALPDAGALGVPVPAAKSCSWIIDAFEPIANADALVGPAGWVSALDPRRGPSDGTSFTTVQRTFTTP